jgi:hypothetical protein
VLLSKHLTFEASMILSEEKLLLKDSYTLVEAEPPEDRSRPLEWRRSLNYLRFEANTFTVDSTHWVNESDMVSDIFRESVEKEREVVPLVKCAFKQKISVSAKISFEGIRDSIYKTSEKNKDEKIYSISRQNRAGNLILNLSEGEPKAEDWGVFKSGSYYGSAGFYDENNCDLTLDITASKEALQDLIKIILSNSLDKVIFNIVISSFSSEVDDALRDWYHPRDLLIHGFSTQAALETMVVRRKSSGSLVVSNLSTSPVADDSNEDELSNISTHTNGFLVKDVIFDTSTLKSIKFALWALVGVLFLTLLK